MKFADVEVRVGEHAVVPCKSIEYDDRKPGPVVAAAEKLGYLPESYPLWSGVKRRWIPLSLWELVMGSRGPVVYRVLRWVFNKTDKQFRRWS